MLTLVAKFNNYELLEIVLYGQHFFKHSHLSVRLQFSYKLNLMSSSEKFKQEITYILRLILLGQCITNKWSSLE